MRVVVVGSGTFGLSAVLHLRRRGHTVTLVCEENAWPAADEERKCNSHDSSRIIRPDYGSDTLYTDLCGEALQAWRKWQDAESMELLNQCGLLVLSANSLQGDSFEHDSFRTLQSRGVAVNKLDASSLQRQFPAWSAQDTMKHGYFNPSAGFVQPINAIRSILRRLSQDDHVTVLSHTKCLSLVTESSRVVGITTDRGVLYGDHVVVACGAWTPTLLPELQPLLRPSPQAVLYIKPAKPDLFRPSSFPPFAADLPLSGCYGFPLVNGLVKLGFHNPPLALDDPSTERSLPASCVQHMIQWARDLFPGLLLATDITSPSSSNSPLPCLPTTALTERAAPGTIVAARLCFYCDSTDGDWLIDRHPALEGVTVASGGSGHAFKFLPTVGKFVADAVEGTPAPDRFRWRSPSAVSGSGMWGRSKL